VIVSPNEAVNTGTPVGEVLYFMRVTLFIALLCKGYELSHPTSEAGKAQYFLIAETGANTQKDMAGLSPWQKKASEKAVEKYAATQEKKWQRWNEAMFGRSD
jgi:hypothetical protein